MIQKPPRVQAEQSVSALLVLVSGLTLGLSFLPVPLWMLAWGALIPMLILWDRTTSVPWFLAEIYTAFLIANAIGFFWPMLHLYPETPWIVFLTQLLVPLLWVLPFAASLPFRRTWGRGPGLFMLISFHLALEVGLSQGPLDFPWPLLGHTQAMAIWLIQFTEFTGVAGLSLWVLLLNTLGFGYYLATRLKRKVILGSVATVLLVAALGFGFWRQDQLAQISSHASVGIVQPAMDDAAWTDQFGAARIGHLLTLSDSLLSTLPASPTLIVWPEMALPSAGTDSRQERIDEVLQQWTAQHDVALLSGTLFPPGGWERPSRFHNRAVLYQPHTDGKQYYDQVRLMPMQPGVSVARQAPWLRAPLHADLVPGAIVRPLNVETYRVGVLMSYEVLISGLASRFVRQDTDFLVSLSMDGWWGRTPGFRPHLNYLRLRAIETRRSVVQVTASTTSALVGPDGSVLYHTSYSQPGAHLVAVPLYTGQTFFVRYGNWLGWGALIFTVVLGGWMSLRETWRWMRRAYTALDEEAREAPRPRRR